MYATLTLAVFTLAAWKILAPRMVGYVRQYTQTMLTPAIYPEKSRTDVFKLPPGTYPAGTIIGPVANQTAQSEVQFVAVGAGNGGTFTLNAYGTYTSALAYNDTTANVQTALRSALTTALGGRAADGATVTGNASNYTVTFSGNLANMPHTLLSAASSVTGTGANIAITRTATGQYPGGGAKTYATGNTDGSGTAQAALQYTTTVTGIGEHVWGGGEWGESHPTCPAYIAGYFRTIDLTGLDADAVADLGRLSRGNVSNLTNPTAILAIAG